MFDASEEGQQLREEKATQGLQTLAGFVRRQRNLLKHPTPAFVVRMEEMTRRAAERWNRRKAEILNQRAAGILSCMSAMHGLGSDGQETFLRTLHRHRDGLQYSFWALQDGMNHFSPDHGHSEHIRPPGLSGHFRSLRTRPSGYAGRYLSRVDVVKTEKGEYARVRTAPNASDDGAPRQWSASSEGAHGGGHEQPQPLGGATAHGLHVGEGLPSSHNAHTGALSVGIRPLAINSWSQSVERGFRRRPAASSLADNTGMGDGAWTDRHDAPRDKAHWDLPSPPKQPKSARAHHSSPRRQAGSAPPPERLYSFMRGRTSGFGPSFSSFDPDVSSPGNVLKTQRWLGELSPKTGFFHTGPSALQPLDGGRRSEGRGGTSAARRAAGDGDGVGKEAVTSGAWLAPSGKSVTYASRETS